MVWGDRMSAFYVKCSQCGELYDSVHLRCPYCQCIRIVQRIFWEQKDYDKEKKLKEANP